jgi:hypothetical protein
VINQSARRTGAAGVMARAFGTLGAATLLLTSTGWGALAADTGYGAINPKAYQSGAAPGPAPKAGSSIGQAAKAGNPQSNSPQSNSPPGTPPAPTPASSSQQCAQSPGTPTASTPAGSSQQCAQYRTPDGQSLGISYTLVSFDGNTEVRTYCIVGGSLDGKCGKMTNVTNPFSIQACLDGGSCSAPETHPLTSDANAFNETYFGIPPGSTYIGPTDSACPGLKTATANPPSQAPPPSACPGLKTATANAPSQTPQPVATPPSVGPSTKTAAANPQPNPVATPPSVGPSTKTAAANPQPNPVAAPPLVGPGTKAAAANPQPPPVAAPPLVGPGTKAAAANPQADPVVTPPLVGPSAEAAAANPQPNSPPGTALAPTPAGSSEQCAQYRIPDGLQSYTITAEVEIPQGGAEGMINALAGRGGGHGLYLLKGKPVFVYNFFDLERFRWEAPTALAPGLHTVVFDFKYDGPGCGKGGTGVLSVDGQQVASRTIPHTIPFVETFYETFDVGVDTRARVDDNDYQPPFRFTGKIDKLTVKLVPLKAADEKLHQQKVQETKNKAR